MSLFPTQRTTPLPGGYMGRILRVDLTTGAAMNLGTTHIHISRLNRAAAQPPQGSNGGESLSGAGRAGGGDSPV